MALVHENISSKVLLRPGGVYLHDNSNIGTFGATSNEKTKISRMVLLSESSAFEEKVSFCPYLSKRQK